MHNEDIHLDSPELQIKPENLEKVSTNTSAFKSLKRKTIVKFIRDLYKALEEKDKFQIIATIKEINLYLIQLSEDESEVIIELPKMEDFLKTFTIFMIPLHFVIFEFSLHSKLRHIFMSILKEAAMELLDCARKIDKLHIHKFDKSSSSKYDPDSFLVDLNKNIFANKNDYSIIEKVFLTLIKRRETLNLIRVIKLTYENILFDIIHGVKYAQKTQKCVIHKKLMSPRVPFLPQLEEVESLHGENRLNGKHTLVLDLDETLIHSFHVDKGVISTLTPDRYYLVRPGTFDLLSALSKYYEIVIFTSGTQAYADSILDSLDISGTFITHRLFRQHTSKNKHDDSKDITKLGRPIERTIIVDNSPANFAYHSDNGLYIKTWEDDIEDQQLYGLTNLLLHIAKAGFPDVREAIHIIKKELGNRDINALPNPYDEVNLKKVIRIVKLSH